MAVECVTQPVHGGACAAPGARRTLLMLRCLQRQAAGQQAEAMHLDLAAVAAEESRMPRGSVDLPRGSLDLAGRSRPARSRATFPFAGPQVSRCSGVKVWDHTCTGGQPRQ